MVFTFKRVPYGTRQHEKRGATFGRLGRLKTSPTRGGADGKREHFRVLAKLNFAVLARVRRKGHLLPKFQWTPPEEVSLGPPAVHSPAGVFRMSVLRELSIPARMTTMVSSGEIAAQSVDRSSRWFDLGFVADPRRNPCRTRLSRGHSLWRADGFYCTEPHLKFCVVRRAWLHRRLPMSATAEE